MEDSDVATVIQQSRVIVFIHNYFILGLQPVLLEFKIMYKLLLLLIKCLLVYNSFIFLGLLGI